MNALIATFTGNVWLLVASSLLGAIVALAVVGALGWLLAEMGFWWRVKHLPPQPVVVYADGTEVYEPEMLAV